MEVIAAENGKALESEFCLLTQNISQFLVAVISVEQFLAALTVIQPGVSCEVRHIHIQVLQMFRHLHRLK